MTCPFCKNDRFYVMAKGPFWHVCCDSCNGIVMDVPANAGYVVLEEVTPEGKDNVRRWLGGV